MGVVRSMGRKYMGKESNGIDTEQHVDTMGGCLPPTDLMLYVQRVDSKRDVCFVSLFGMSNFMLMKMDMMCETEEDQG